ncbi:hypothetical protein ACIRQQ_01765 [Streptomyces fuscichromogenes]|uniref:hypothetical protein n=1 Tax=Streptomyces fuscichromogenes TaxID=1324013 RepID=UPI00381DCC62
MRRTVRTLSVAVLAGAAFGATGTAVAAAGPAAEVSPGSARPGTTVIVSVTCAKTGGRGTGQVPSAIDATSAAFAGRTVRLARVEQDGGLVYRGTAQVVSGDGPGTYTEGDAAAGAVTAGEAAAGDAAGGATGAGRAGTRTVDGSCPAAGDARPRPWSARLAVAPGDGGTVLPGDGGAMPQVGGGTAPETGTAPEAGGGAVFPGDGGTAPHGDDDLVTGGDRGDDGMASRGDDGMFARGDEAIGTVPGGDEATGTAPRGGEATGTTPHGDDGTAGRGDGDGTGSRGDHPAASHGDDGVIPHGDGDAGRPCAGGGQQACGGGDRQECDGARGGADSCAVAGVQHGVEAGDGGAYNTSVPALVAGGMLIAAACCGAVYRLWGGRFRTYG